jgi:hypothetical protein
MSSIVLPARWIDMMGNLAYKRYNYIEYGSYGPGAPVNGKSIGQVKPKRDVAARRYDSWPN